MSRLSDLVLDSKIHTKFRGSVTIHLYPEIDDAGRRFSREEQWKWEKPIGRGGFGQVTLQRCVTKGAGQDSCRAVKIVQKSLNDPEGLDYNRELEAIAKFSHERYKRWFVKSFGWFEDEDSIYVTMEYCRHGDLHHYLQRKRLVPVGEAQQLAYQILDGLNQMHQNNFAHRDLKPANVLIKAMPPEQKWWIVLADFGISKRDDERNGPTTTIKGTASFMAPELLGYLDQVRPKSITGFQAADMWAVGEIIFQMLTSEATFQSPMELLTYCQGNREFPSNRLPVAVGRDCADFVTKMMMPVPKDRITITQSLQHVWMGSLLEDEFAALNIEQSSSQFRDNSWNVSASAQWTGLSNLEHGHTQTTALQRPERLQSTSGESSASCCSREDLESTISAGITLIKTFQMTEKLEFSPEGKQLVTVESDERHKMAQLWSAESGMLLQTLAYPSDQNIREACFSPDSKRLVTITLSDANLWDTGSGTLLQTFPGQTCFSPEFSPDSKRLVISTYKPSMAERVIVELWCGESGKLVKTLGKFSQDTRIRTGWMTFSPDSKRLMIRDGRQNEEITIQLRDAVSGMLLLGLTKVGIRPVKFSPDGSLLLCIEQFRSGCSCYTCRESEGLPTQLWSAESGKLLQTFPTSYISADFSPDSKHLVTGEHNTGKVELWSTESGTLLQTLITCDRPYASFSPDGKRLIIRGPDYRSNWKLQLWSAESWTLLQTFEGILYFHETIFSPDFKRLITKDSDEKVRLWDARSGSLVEILTDVSTVGTIVFSSDSKWLLSRDKSRKTACLWCAKSGTLVHTFTGLWNSSGLPHFSPDGKWVVADVEDDLHTARTTHLFSVESGKLVQMFTEFSYVNKFCFSSDSKRLIMQKDQLGGGAQLWSLDVKKR